MYDHRIVQAIQARRARARAAEGAEIGSSDGPAPVKYVASVRVYVGPRYRAAHSRWREQVADWVDAASGVLGPAYGVRLDVTDVLAWDPTCDAAELESCLSELQRTDAGENAHWVLGVVGAVPRFTTSFDELGIAAMPGKHVVLRDLSDPEEREAIDKAFPTHTASRRAEIYARRSRHKRLAVLLHELGHTLGAIHTRRRQSLLFPVYDDRMASFSDSNAELIRAGLRDRFSEEGGHAHARRALAGVVDADLVFSERERLLAWYARFESIRAQAGASQAGAVEETSHPFVVTGDEDELLRGLREVERQAYRRAVAATYAGAHAEAWALIEPLVETHADCHAVQHLACGLAMSLMGDRSVVSRICERAQSLSAEPGS